MEQVLGTSGVSIVKAFANAISDAGLFIILLPTMVCVLGQSLSAIQRDEKHT